MMIKHRTVMDYILLFVKGVFMGLANKIPGVSGGAVAFVAGFYEEFVHSLQRLNYRAVGFLLRKRYSNFAQYVNLKFLLVLFGGIIFSFFSISKLLDFFLVRYEIAVWSLFFGLIIGSIYHINKSFHDWNRKTIISLILGITIGLWISFLDPMMENRNLFFIFICGIISISGMPIPGFSGSFILMILGNYVLIMVDSVNAFYDLLKYLFAFRFEILDNPEKMEMVYILLVFVLGSIFGLISLSNVLSFVLKKYHQITISLIIGFIIGSLGAVWPWKHNIYLMDKVGNYIFTDSGDKIVIRYDKYLPQINSDFVFPFTFIIIGILIIVVLERIEAYKKKA